MNTLVRAFVAAVLIVLPVQGQQLFTARDLGGGCGGTTGYPTLFQATPTTVDFVVARSTCVNNPPSGFPVLVVIGLREVAFPVPFLSTGALNVVPGCTWHVADHVVALSGQGPIWSGTVIVPLWPAHITLPQPATVFVQALVTCTVSARSGAPMEVAASNGWAITVQ